MKKVLIIDDEKNIVDALTPMLEDEGFKVFKALDGKKGISIFNTEKPDVVLLDIWMPEMNGYDATQIIKKNPDFNTIPVIAFTASAMKETEKKIIELFDGYLRKPINKKDLFQELRKYLKFQIRKVPKENQPEESNTTKDSIKTLEAIEYLPQLVNILENEFLREAEKLSNSLVISNLKDFLEKLKVVHQKYPVPLMADFIEDISKNIDNFKIVKVKNLIKEFPLLVEQLKSRSLKDE